MNHLAYQRRWNNDRASPWRKWGRWIALGEASPEARAGVYVLAVRQPDAQRKISRLLGVDHQGTLDIGESMNLRRRIASLAKCAFADGFTGHMAGWRYRYLGLHTKIDGELVIAWKYGDESYHLEAETMALYVNAFGELPPLNYKANWALLKAQRGEMIADV
jgi:hypothetical protein